MILRFCELSAGRATLCGHDLAEYDADDVRRLIGGCPQDPHIFDTTVAANLRLARPAASDDDLSAAAARARLLPWISSLPLGMQTRVGPGGAAMSGGERERLALARALLADPQVLILDEPGARLEPPTRRYEPDALEQMDEVVLLDRGKVAGRATGPRRPAANHPQGMTPTTA